MSLPDQASNYLKLQALAEKLERGMNYRLVLFLTSKSSPDGLLYLWAEQQKACGKTQFAWLSLTETDNQPYRFLNKLSSALVEMDPKLSADLERLSKKLCATYENLEAIPTSSEGELDLEAGMVELINLLAGPSLTGLSNSLQDFFLIMENYHLITCPEIHNSVSLLLDYLPLQMHLIISCEGEPPLQIPRLRVRRQLLELSESDL